MNGDDIKITTFLGRKPTVFNRGMNALSGAGRCSLWRKCKSVVSYWKQAVSYEAESPAFRHGEYANH